MMCTSGQSGIKCVSHASHASSDHVCVPNQKSVCPALTVTRTICTSALLQHGKSDNSTVSSCGLTPSAADGGPGTAAAGQRSFPPTLGPPGSPTEGAVLKALGDFWRLLQTEQAARDCIARLEDEARTAMNPFVDLVIYDNPYLPYRTGPSNAAVQAMVRQRPALSTWNHYGPHATGCYYL